MHENRFNEYRIPSGMLIVFLEKALTLIHMETHLDDVSHSVRLSALFRTLSAPLSAFLRVPRTLQKQLFGQRDLSERFLNWLALTNNRAEGRVGLQANVLMCGVERRDQGVQAALHAAESAHLRCNGGADTASEPRVHKHSQHAPR